MFRINSCKRTFKEEVIMLLDQLIHNVRLISSLLTKKGKATLFDVKSVSRRKTKSYNCKPGDTINRSVSKKQKMLGVKIYYADGD
jgi:hypothetical protein